MKNVNVFKFLVISMVMVSVVPAFASPARVSGMGMESDTLDIPGKVGIPGTLWMIGGDDTIIRLNPAQLSVFKPEIWARLNPDALGCGVIVGLAPEVNLYATTGFPLTLDGFPVLPAVPAVSQEQFNLMVAFPVGPVRLGISGMVTDVYSDSTTVGSESQRNNLIWSVGFGALFEISSSMSFDASAKGLVYSISHTTGAPAANDYSANTFDIGAFARFNWNIVSGNTLHVAAQYWFKDRSFTDAALPSESDITNQVTLGFSDEITITDKTTLFAGAQGAFSQNNATAGDSRNIQVKVAGGMESAFTDFLTLRLGANRIFFDQVEDANAATKTNLQSGANVNVGAGITIGELVFDLDFNTLLFSYGPNFISGGSGADSPGAWTVDFVITYYLDGKTGVSGKTKGAK